MHFFLISEIDRFLLILQNMATPVPLCGFCFGGKEKNKHGEAEELVSCHDCGNSGEYCLHQAASLTVETTCPVDK